MRSEDAKLTLPLVSVAQVLPLVSVARVLIALLCETRVDPCTALKTSESIAHTTGVGATLQSAHSIVEQQAKIVLG